MSDLLNDPPMWLWMRVTEHQARELLAGRIDEELKSMARCMCNWEFDLRQRTAERLAEDAHKKLPRKRRNA
jgi:hypothetical protein